MLLLFTILSRWRWGRSHTVVRGQLDPLRLRVRPRSGRQINRHFGSVRTIEIFFVSADNDICRYDMPIKTDKQISARYYFYRPITEISADNTDIGLIKFILVTHKEQIC